MDLLEIPKKGHLLVVVDYYSKWPEVAFLTKTDAGTVIKCLQSMFYTHGLPETLRSDNGPPFAAQELEGFLEYLAIDHKKGIPYWPQSDGEVERFNKTLMNIITIAQLQGKDWKGGVQDFLFQYPSTPHAITLLSPAELLIGRKLRDKLPQVQPPCDQATEAEWQAIGSTTTLLVSSSGGGPSGSYPYSSRSSGSPSRAPLFPCIIPFIHI